ncbi:MAG: hypothetical protein IJ175_11015 [Clostridia bacterium]|nr:hypothetical protein [Clostridia bacterium]
MYCGYKEEPFGASYAISLTEKYAGEAGYKSVTEDGLEAAIKALHGGAMPEDKYYSFRTVNADVSVIYEAEAEKDLKDMGLRTINRDPFKIRAVAQVDRRRRFPAAQVKPTKAAI